MSKTVQVSELLKKALVWDNHACMPLRWDDESFLPELERFRKNGFDAITLNIGFGEQGVEDHVRMLATFRHWLARHTDQYVLVETADDIDRAHKTGKLAVMFDIEGARGIDDQLSLIQMYYDLGVRWMLIAYNKRNLAGSGVHDDADEGLTDFGRAMIDEMARVGMVTCCSHTGYRTAAEVLEYASNPVIFSHSNPKALFDHERNIPDDLMKACAAKGGVVGINGVSLFLGTEDDIAGALVRHIDYAVQLIGADHVGLGLDFVFDLEELNDFLASMNSTFPPGYGPCSFVAPEQVAEVVEALLGLGYAEDDLRKILGENHMRVARQVWKPRALAG